MPNFGPAGHGPRLQPGMTIAVEPMVCQGGWQVRVLEDKWTTVTADGSLAAHYENTILITEGRPGDSHRAGRTGRMRVERAQIVRSRQGRDQGCLFCVLDASDGVLLLADGKKRRVAAPKRKNAKHVEYVGAMDHPAIELVREGQPVRDRQLRQLLASFRDEMEV